VCAALAGEERGSDRRSPRASEKALARRCWAGTGWAGEGTWAGGEEKKWRAARRRSGRGKDWAAGLACFPISFPFLFQANSNLLEFKSNLNSTPMHSTK
jgi:hypothetical protein